MTLRHDVDEEFRFHLEMRAAELERQGYRPDEARAEALRRFGDLDGARAACVASDLRRDRAHRRRLVARDLGKDLRVTLRQMRRRPLVAAVVILTLGLGIGAGTALYSTADHVLWRPLPIAGEDRVVTLWEADARTGERREVSPGNFFEWSARAGSFEAVGLAQPYGHAWGAGGRAEALSSWQVSAGFFPALGVEAVRGRLFLPEDHVPGARPVVVVSYDFWQGRLGGDPAAVGGTLVLDGRSVALVGVLPPHLEYPRRKADLWAPLILGEQERADRTSAYMEAVARLRPGVGVAAARKDMDRVAAVLAAESPGSPGNRGVRVLSLRQHLFGDVGPPLLILLGAVVLLLLGGCANVAGVLLADAARRERELAVRTAIGASRGRLARLLLVQSGVFGVCAGALGLAVSVAGVRILAALAPPDLPRLDTVTIDAAALGFGAALALGAVLLAGLAPAMRAARTDVASALRGATDRGRRGLRDVLVAVEVALAFVLLVGAGLLVRSFDTLRSNDLGFVPRDLVALQAFLYDNNPTPELRRQRMDRIAAEIAALPGVTGVGLVTALPFHPSQIDAQGTLAIVGDARPPQRVYVTAASPGYFAAARIPLRRGRAFADGDRAGAPRVALVNETLARRIFPGDDPVGKRVLVGGVEREIVGVVGDVLPTGFDSDPRAELYGPMAQSATGSITFVARVTGDPRALVPAVRDRIWAVDPGQAIYHAAAVEDMVAATLVERRFNLTIVSAVSLVALLLAALGVYGLISFETSRRTHEIGVRMALGARRQDVLAMVVGRGVRAALPGVVAGLLGAAAAAHLARRMLYGVAPVDPLTFGAIAAGMVGIAAVAAYFPARRAAGVDPMQVIRRE